MTARMLKPFVLGACVALLLAPQAIAAKKRPTPTPPATATAGSSACRGATLFPCGPIYNSNDYLGQDPDPFIRLSIQRDLGAKYGGPD